MRLRLAFLSALIVAIAGVMTAAGSAATLITSANITNDADGDNEVDIAINPTNPQNLIAAWNDYGNGNSCGLGYSLNGGQTWHTDWLRGVTPPGGNPTFDYGAGDPSVGFLNDGTAVLSCAAWAASKSQPSAVFASRSTDGGQTWAPVQQLTFGKNLGHLQDHNMLTIDRYGNRALVAYTVWNGYAARSFTLISSDGGLTYKGPYEIASDYKRNAVDTFDVSLAGAPDGTIYATSGIWQHVQEWNEQAIVISQMRPGETKFTRSVKVRDLVPAPYNLPGEQWRTSMQGSIGVDPAGTVNVLTGDYVTGNLDLYLAKSTDHGTTFPSQVNLRPGQWLDAAADDAADGHRRRCTAAEGPRPHAVLGRLHRHRLAGHGRRTRLDLQRPPVARRLFCDFGAVTRIEGWDLPGPTPARSGDAYALRLRRSSSACALSARRRVRSAFSIIWRRASRSAFVNFFFAIVPSKQDLDSSERARDAAHIE